MQTWDAKVLGVVFDISLRHVKSGKRVLDLVKESLIAYLRETWQDDDVFYLYHPDVVEPLYYRGESVAMIGNYGTDGWRFDLSYALKQTLYVLADQDVDLNKHLLLVSDRLQSARPLDQIELMQRGESAFEFDLTCMGLTKHCDLTLLPNAWNGVKSNVEDVFSGLEEALQYGKR